MGVRYIFVCGRWPYATVSVGFIKFGLVIAFPSFDVDVSERMMKKVSFSRNT